MIAYPEQQQLREQAGLQLPRMRVGCQYRHKSRLMHVKTAPRIVIVPCWIDRINTKT